MSATGMHHPASLFHVAKKVGELTFCFLGSGSYDISERVVLKMECTACKGGLCNYLSRSTVAMGWAIV